MSNLAYAAPHAQWESMTAAGHMNTYNNGYNDSNMLFGTNSSASSGYPIHEDMDGRPLAHENLETQRVEKDGVAEGPIREKRVLSTLVEEDGEDEDGEAIEMPALKKFKAAETASVVKAPATLPLARPRKGRQPLGFPTSEPLASRAQSRERYSTSSLTLLLAIMQDDSKMLDAIVAVMGEVPEVSYLPFSEVVVVLVRPYKMEAMQTAYR
ncbi:hypothetical protein B0J14DRAFT_661334 [Halenospora varia]|nr:hypothetical protein B0J14DRAFT_661334 [Halenospora varia]